MAHPSEEWAKLAPARRGRRPTINTRCVADRYSGPCERIAEFTTPSGKGGLISIRERDDGRVIVCVYRVDSGVTVEG